MIVSHGGVPLYDLYIDPFWNFWRKSRTLFGIFVPDGGLQNVILRAVLGKMASIFKIFKTFPEIVDFQSKLGESYQSIQSSFGLSFVPSK